MNVFATARSHLLPKLIIVTIFLCTAGVIAGALLQSPNAIVENWTGAAAITSALVFVIASILVFRSPRLGYVLGVTAGVAALSWVVHSELRLSPGMNSWIALNTGDYTPGGTQFVTFAKLKIVTIAIIVVAIASSALRLLPPRLTLLGYPLCQRTWPAFAVSFVVVSVWFVNSVTPYRIPLIADGTSAELTILHLTKHGLQIQETAMSISRDGEIFVQKNDRHLFQYRFTSHIVYGTSPENLHERARGFARSTQLLNTRNTPMEAPRSWNAEAWFVLLNGSRTVSFTSDDKTALPTEIKDFFYEIERLPLTEIRLQTIRDVCMGFCYTPLSTLAR